MIKQFACKDRILQLVYLHRAVVLCSVEMMLSPPSAEIVLEAGTTWSTDVRSLVGFV